MSEQENAPQDNQIKKKLTIDQGRPQYSNPGETSNTEAPPTNKDLNQVTDTVKELATQGEDSKQFITKYWDTVGYDKAHEVAKAAATFTEFEIDIAEPQEDIRKSPKFHKKRFSYHRITMGQYDFIAGKKATLIDIDRMSALTLKEYIDQKIAIPENFDKYRVIRKEKEIAYYNDAAQMYLGMTPEQVNGADRVMLEFWVDVCEHKQINPKLEIAKRPSSTYT
jgi:hypothetical protein